MKTHLQITLELLGAYVIPIHTLRNRAQSPYLVGTGVLLLYEEEYYLVTAKHVLDEISENRIITSGKGRFLPIDVLPTVIGLSQGPDPDIAVMRLSRNAALGLHDIIQAVEPPQLGAISAYDKLTLYAFVGYPHSRNKPKFIPLLQPVKLRPYYFVCREFLDVSNLSSTAKDSRVHFALRADFRKMTDISLAARVQPPSPFGISGCGVWRIKLDAQTGMVAEPALAGIGIEYIEKRKALIATHIGVPAQGIAKLATAPRSESNPNVADR